MQRDLDRFGKFGDGRHLYLGARITVHAPDPELDMALHRFHGQQGVLVQFNDDGSDTWEVELDSMPGQELVLHAKNF